MGNSSCLPSAASPTRTWQALPENICAADDMGEAAVSFLCKKINAAAGSSTFPCTAFSVPQHLS